MRQREGRVTRRHGGRRTGAVAVTCALALLAAVVGGGLWWWQDAQRAAAQAAEAYGERAAASLARGTLPAGLDVTDRPAAQKDLDTLLDGMGSLEHRVRVRDVELDEGEDSGRVVLEHSWRIQQDKNPWTYVTRLPIERDGDAWRGRWSPQVVVDGIRDTERIRAVRVGPDRAAIVGNDDTPLVEQREVARIGIDRSEVADDDAARRSAQRLAKVVDVDAAEFATRVAGAGPKAFVEAITYRVEAPELLAARADLDDIPGATEVSAELPLAPTSGFARPLLGTAGPATAEIVEASKGRVRAGDVVGLSGLQKTFDEQLSGTAGYTVEAVDRESDGTRALDEVPATDGRPVSVTLDESVQLAAEASLEEVEPASAIVAIRPSDGHVLAAASGPGSKGYSTATLGRYAPGSTFKSVSALALLRSGLTEESEVDCPRTTVVDGRTFKNFDDYPPDRLGRVSLRTVIANSCNTGLMQQIGRLEPDSLPSAAAALGLTAEPALGVPAALGSVPVPGSDVETAASMIGQGKVLSTPLGMATVAASLAAGGPVSPVLVLDDEERSTPERSLGEQEQREMLDMLRAVVTEGGGTILADVPGEPVLAKTGTAEFGEPDSRGVLETHAWMIAIQGDLAVSVFIEKGSGGGRVAGPVMRDFLERVGGSA